MSRGHELSAEAARDREQLGELDPAVARGARARRLPRDVPVDERLHNRTRKKVASIKCVVRESQCVGDTARVVLILWRTAATVVVVGLRIVPQVQRYPDDFVPSILKPRRGDRRVDPTAHSDQNSLSSAHRRIWGAPLPAEFNVT